LTITNTDWEFSPIETTTTTTTTTTAEDHVMQGTSNAAGPAE